MPAGTHTVQDLGVWTFARSTKFAKPGHLPLGLIDVDTWAPSVDTTRLPRRWGVALADREPWPQTFFVLAQTARPTLKHETLAKPFLCVMFATVPRTMVAVDVCILFSLLRGL